MSVPALRPPRTTTNYGWPIPGDASPADYVTDTGNLADAIDATLINAGGIPLVNPGDLSSPPYNTPIAGQQVDVMVDQANSIIWRFRCVPGAYPWVFVGGPPLEVYATAAISAPVAWGAMGTPQLIIPRPGIYQIFAKTGQVNVSTASARGYLSVDVGSTPNTPVITGTTSETLLASGFNATLVNFGRTAPVPAAGVAFRMIHYSPQSPAINSINRGMRAIPVCVM